MNVTDFYPLEPTRDKETFYFESIGQSGVFTKVIVFEPQSEPNLFNLALCVEDEYGDWLDDVVTNNDDFLKTFSTVSKAVFEFFETHPNAVLQIRADERRRLRVYNGIFSRRYEEIIQTYAIAGISVEQKEAYQPGKFYDWFEITLKTPQL